MPDQALEAVEFEGATPNCGEDSAKHELRVFYTPAQSLTDVAGLSPSACKPALIAAAFSQVDGVRLESNFAPLTPAQLMLAHDREHVLGVLNCTRNNGFGNRLESVARSLPWTSGSLYAAAKYAIQNKTVAMSPTSGFHHAQFGSCDGFCTFNGLMIASLLLHGEGRINRVGIIDFDAHYGNGTVNIISHLALDWVAHYTFGDFANNTEDFECWLSEIESGGLETRFADCDLLLYQAGADPHVDDPFGGYLTTEQMRRRDQIVFRMAQKATTPIAWNLAGGYQEPAQKVIDLHMNTLLECKKVYGF